MYPRPMYEGKYNNFYLKITIFTAVKNRNILHERVMVIGVGERTGLVVRASDSGSGDPGSILDRVGVLFP